jgi:glucosyl-3-phosphoglycerate synthase
VLPEVSSWLRERSSTAARWPAPAVLAAKGGARISVVLPARSERETVGQIVAAIRAALIREIPLVDEIVVIDSRSTDDTAEVAAAAGARVVAQDDVLPRLPRQDGKGEALWKSLAATSGDVIVFVDSDLRNFSPSFVTGLLGPLLHDPSLRYVKASYDRPLHDTGDVGGRVTELVARPLLNMHWPLLAGFVQPLAGEVAARRELLERLPFVTGYGVELGMLVDVLSGPGLDAMAQVDLGTRVHAHQSVPALGRMAAQIWQTAWSRLERRGLVNADERPSGALTQFRRSGSAHRPETHDITVAERPPMIEIPEYLEGAQEVAAGA